VFLTPCANFYRPVEELEYTDLLRSTFTQPDHERGFNTWRTLATHPQCVFCSKRYRWGRVRWNVTWTPPLQKQQLARKGLWQRVQNHKQHRVARIEPVFWKTLLAEADASRKRNLILVGGQADNAVNLCGEGNSDAKRQCLGKGQTMLTKPPSQAEFEECWE
jgi:hypothetical protein